VQRWQDDDSQVGLVDRDLTRRRAGLADEVTRIDLDDLGAVLEQHFDLHLDASEVDALRARVQARSSPAG
jgi:arylamine N-acetyltransferase